MLARGWIVPVGGATPDRHKGRPAWPAQGPAQGPAQELILIFRLLSNACAGVDRSGRGCNPRPAQCNPRPAQGPTGSAGSRISARTSARIDSHFPALIQCLRGGGSFRSGVQPPTGTRSGVQPPTGIRSTGLAGSMGGAGGRGEILLSVYVYADGRLGPYWGGRAAVCYAYAPFVTMI